MPGMTADHQTNGGRDQAIFNGGHAGLVLREKTALGHYASRVRHPTLAWFGVTECCQQGCCQRGCCRRRCR